MEASTQFGLTSYGDFPNMYVAKSAAFQGLVFHDIEERVYEEAFRRHAISDTQLAEDLEVDGAENILRMSLVNVLRDVLERNPTPADVRAWQTYLDVETSCVMSLKEFLRSVRQLREFSAKPQLPQKWSSYLCKRTEWLQHRRLPYEPITTLSCPMTESQMVGWGNQTKLDEKEKRFPQRSTDVTRKEGRDHTSYFGYYTMQGA